MCAARYALVSRAIAGGYVVSGGGAALTNVTGVSSGISLIAAAGDSDGRNAAAGSFVLPLEHGIISSSGGITAMWDPRIRGDRLQLDVGDWVVVQREGTVR
eukprot:COSAG06_NODE_640_length_13515_cov_6.190206_1_plen_101_part_00